MSILGPFWDETRFLYTWKGAPNRFIGTFPVLLVYPPTMLSRSARQEFIPDWAESSTPDFGLCAGQRRRRRRRSRGARRGHHEQRCVGRRARACRKRRHSGVMQETSLDTAFWQLNGVVGGSARFALCAGRSPIKLYKVC